MAVSVAREYARLLVSHVRFLWPETQTRNRLAPGVCSLRKAFGGRIRLLVSEALH